MNKNSDLITQAASEYLDRKDERKEPDGYITSNGCHSKKRDHREYHWGWYPGPDEEQSCCKGLSQPEWKFHFPLMVHCRTANHVARLFGVDRTNVLREARRLRAEMPDRFPETMAA